MSKACRDYTWPVVSDDPLEEGLRILARIILKKIIEQRRLKAKEHDPSTVAG